MSDAKTIPSGGTVAPGFEAVRDAFIEAQAKDRGGAQLCVYRHGRQVVDLWAGHDPENDRPYGEETIGVLMSCTKGLVAGAVHMLVERGKVDLDAPMARYWPQFGQAGKDKITVRQAIAHHPGRLHAGDQRGLARARLLRTSRARRGAACRGPPPWARGRF